LIGLAVVFALLNNAQTFKTRVAIFTCVGFAIFFWKTYELLMNKDHRARPLFVFIIVLMTLASLMGLARVWVIFHDVGGVSQSLNTETVAAMTMKWGYYTFFLLNYFLIFSFYMQVSKNKEEDVIKELMNQQEIYEALEVKKKKAEALTLELQAVLAEKTNLLKAVTNQSKATVLGVLASSIAHEINNPLCATSLNLEIAEQMLEEVDNAAEAEELIRNARNDCLRIQEVVEKLRKLFTREGSEFTRINLYELVQETCVFLEREFTINNIKLQTSFAQKNLMVLGDRGQLQMVILNLLTNAMHALSDNMGQKLLCIDLTRNGIYVELSFEDNGCGIPDWQLDKIFEAHYSSKDQGMGIGLWLVKTIIENHNGSIHAMSTDKGGARFNLSLMLN
jgi:C4-dicarboxylate-specific signal transduction histidine kinase